MANMRSLLGIGLSRGLIELRHNLASIVNYIFFPTLAVFVMYLLRDMPLGDTDYSLGQYAVPGIISMNILFTGLMGIASTLMLEREDGTLHRARAIPHGAIGYFLGKLISQALLCLVTFTVVLALSMILFDGFALHRANSLLTLSWVLPLGVVAMLPIGVVLGSALRHPRQLSFVSLLLMGLTAVSGVFYPLSLQSPMLQLIGQAFPLYWLGLGVRGAMLPDAFAADELGESWRLLETAGVLSVWAVVGSALAVYVLRKSSRRAVGSRMKESSP